MRSRSLFVFYILLLLGNGVWSAIDLLSPTSDWTALPYNGANVFSDFTEDTQAVSDDLDLVGYGDQYAVYTRFDSVNTLGFRLRLAGDKSPAGFEGQVWIGADLPKNGVLDGNLDIFIGVKSSVITFNLGGDLENISPSTTSIDSQNPLFSIPTSPLNYNWTPVTSQNDPLGALTDIDGTLNPSNTSGNDYFLTFTFDFDQFATTVNGLGSFDTFTSSSSIAYVVGTATQANSLNSDLNGVEGQVNSTTTWTTLGAITPELNLDGAPVPEPATTVLVISAITFVFLVVRRRRT